MDNMTLADYGTLANIVAAATVLLRLSALGCAVMSGAYFQRAADHNRTKDVILGAVLFFSAFACSAIATALTPR